MDFLLIALAVAAIAAALAAVFIALRGQGKAPEPVVPRLDALAATQSEIAGRFAQAIAGQTELQRMLWPSASKRLIAGWAKA